MLAVSDASHGSESVYLIPEASGVCVLPVYRVAAPAQLLQTHKSKSPSLYLASLGIRAHSRLESNSQK
eukprot:6145536-Amphidinium_carterae.1